MWRGSPADRDPTSGRSKTGRREHSRGLSNWAGRLGWIVVLLAASLLTVGASDGGEERRSRTARYYSTTLFVDGEDATFFVADRGHYQLRIDDDEWPWTYVRVWQRVRVGPDDHDYYPLWGGCIRSGESIDLDQRVQLNQELHVSVRSNVENDCDTLRRTWAPLIHPEHWGLPSSGTATLSWTVISRETARYAGASRFDTAVAISKAQFPDGASTVYLARATAPLIDAVAGGSLTDGPTLLVPPCDRLPDTVRAEIERLDPRRVVALGGPGSICDATLDQAADGRNTGRYAGASRFDTAVAISKAQFPDGAPTVYLARATAPLVDAVAGGSLTDGPTLLVPPCDRLPDTVRAEIERLDPFEVVALGGPGSICDDTLDQAADGRNTGRYAGTSRFDTAVAISKAQFPFGASTVYLARAHAPLVDAVAGGSLTDGPTLLVPPCDRAPVPVRAEIERLDPDRVIALGGPGAICDTTLDHAANR